MFTIHFIANLTDLHRCQVILFSFSFKNVLRTSTSRYRHEVTENVALLQKVPTYLGISPDRVILCTIISDSNIGAVSTKGRSLPLRPTFANLGTGWPSASSRSHDGRSYRPDLPNRPDRLRGGAGCRTAAAAGNFRPLSLRTQLRQARRQAEPDPRSFRLTTCLTRQQNVQSAFPLVLFHRCISTSAFPLVHLHWFLVLSTLYHLGVIRFSLKICMQLVI